MSKLILNSEFNLYEQKGIAFCDSLQVAETFERRHTHVIDAIDVLTQPTSGLSEEFINKNFIQSTYKDASGKRNKKYLLTRDGFTMTVMEFKTVKARAFKEAYINRFNAMENFIVSLHTAKLEHPAFTRAVMMAHEEPKHYHFSNEADMINRIVLGMSAKDFRIKHDIPKGASIRPYLSTNQIKAVEELQRADIGLLTAIPDFAERKAALQSLFDRMVERKLLLTA